MSGRTSISASGLAARTIWAMSSQTRVDTLCLRAGAIFEAEMQSTSMSSIENKVRRPYACAYHGCAARASSPRLPGAHWLIHHVLAIDVERVQVTVVMRVGRDGVIGSE